MRPDEKLLRVVVHSGWYWLVAGMLWRLRRNTAFPARLSLDAVVLARDVRAEAWVGESVGPRFSAEAAERREREATPSR
jgi:hypothetical protein